jgi:tRNA (guanine10-N2)-dimethyltransferase
LAELESLYGSDNVVAVGGSAAVLHIAPCSIDFARLGGAIRLCKMLTELDTTNWKQIERFLIQASPSQAAKMPEGKMHLGFSAYDLSISPQQLLATGLTVKKVIQQTGRSVRLVPNKTTELNTAQVIHNNLTKPNGWELVFVRNGEKTLVAQTVFVQNIDSYAERDFGRPKRDARVGMLPPKLAQIIINLATGPSEFAAIKDKLSNDAICMPPEDVQKMHSERRNTTLLDPFCGTGVVLQEALLMGYSVIGTDIEPRMIDYTRQNLEWLAAKYPVNAAPTDLASGDATATQWPPVSMVACETYLGRPFTSTPKPEILAQTMTDCNLIIKKFLRNIHGQLRPGARLCLAIPAWQVKTGQFRHLPLVDQITDLGYNQVRFERIGDAELLYYRPDQIVARELLIITRK